MLRPRFARLAALLLVGVVVIVTLSSQPSSAASVLLKESSLQEHERRSVAPVGWTQGQRLSKRSTLPIRIALKQRNIDHLDAHLMSVSQPDSEHYGKHWSPAQVADMFAPTAETVETITQWLSSTGISMTRVQTSASRGWMSFEATVDEAERLLNTQYHAWLHEATGTIQPAVALGASYSLPAHVRPHVDFITPTLHFDAKVRREESAPVTKREALAERDQSAAIRLGLPGSGSLPKLKALSPGYTFFDQLQNCDTDITPLCLRALYKIPQLVPFLPTNSKNSFGVVEYTPQTYVSTDMDLFFANFSKTQKQKRPTLVSIDGGFVTDDNQDTGINSESNLDLQYAMALTNPIPVTLYQVGDAQRGASFNDFLDALDGSYCAGDDPFQDSQYPNPNPGGYNGPKNCGGAKATKVISTSYGYNEKDLSPAYELRQCNEYAKLGLLGTTFVYSSGDYGVGGNGGQCIDPATGSYNDGKSGQFNPAFPSSCPYILSVGATQINPNSSVLAPESACEQVIFSGGGFSNVFAQPSYQRSAVQNYFAKNTPTYSATQYNNSRTTRGYPDVSANGARYVVALEGGFDYHLYGTSASAPTFASVLTLINEARLNIGKSPVGFVNPALYANPSMLNDITDGNNPGCGTDGFTAVSGWDPVTGLGTPNYPKMLAYFLSH